MSGPRAAFGERSGRIRRPYCPGLQSKLERVADRQFDLTDGESVNASATCRIRQRLTLSDCVESSQSTYRIAYPFVTLRSDNQLA